MLEINKIMNQFKRLEIHLTDHCNLNCARCFHYAPLVDKPYFLSLDEFKKDLNQVSQFLFPTAQVILLGGEPLLHPQFLDFCRIAYEILPKTISIEVWTNGILLADKDTDFFNTINTLNIKFHINNYLANLELDKLVKEKIKNLELSKSAKHTFNYCALDFINENKLSKSEIFNKCTLNKECICVQLRHGNLYKCPQECYNNILADYFNLKFPADYKKQSLDIYNCTKNDILTFINTPSNFCKYCNRWTQISDENSKTISRKELSEWVKYYKD